MHMKIGELFSRARQTVDISTCTPQYVMLTSSVTVVVVAGVLGPTF